MKCFHHPDRDAVVTCCKCGKGLCNDCTITVDGKIYCPVCFGEIVEYQKKLVKTLHWRLLFFAAFAVIGFIGLICSGSFGVLYGQLVFGSLPIAYYYMKGTPDPYVPTTLDAAGSLVLFRLAVACLIGPFMAAKGYFEYKKMLDITKSNAELHQRIMQNL